LLLTGAISILIGFVPGYLTGLKYGLNTSREHTAHLASSQPAPANPANTGLDLQSAEIIKELNCVCGCKMELKPCTCDEKRGSQEIKTFVQALVLQQVARPEIISRLKEKYGDAVLIKKT
jgi:hypothetical protein